jgi:hypothetical protein
MRKYITLIISVFVFSTLNSYSDELYAVPTFECVGIYYQSESSEPCQVQYREADALEWKNALDLVYDKRDVEHRGSIVNLKPDTEYQIQIMQQNQIKQLICKTLSEDFPVGKTTELENGTMYNTLTISESGTAHGYHLVSPPVDGKTVNDVMNGDDYNLVIDADYVIIRGLELKNAAIHAIYIPKNRHHIVIEDCHFTFWGRIGGPRSYGNRSDYDSAVYADLGCGNLVIQRNLIENPRGASNDWDTGHPSGPQAITLRDSIGGNIIRYNEIRSTEDHGFNDAIGGMSNYSFEGSPNRDSDIYGNIISNVWDDAIESEGANMNVRIWGNYIHHTFVHIATACTSKGPLYIYRNVFGESRRTHRDPLGNAMIKTGRRDEFGGGRRFIFHNTALQPNGAFHAFTDHPVSNCVTRNNIFDCPGRLATNRDIEDPGDYDYDLFTGMDRGVAQERHGVRGNPNIQQSYYLTFYPLSTTTKIQWGKVEIKQSDKVVTLTDPVLTVPNPVIDAGDVIPNFNEDYHGAAPDLGAFELGNPPILFGRRAQGDGFWAPWELH